MKLTEVTLAYPFIRYRLDITHFTARRSTAIEWLILETVQRIQLVPAYQGMTVESFFSLMFGITDTNQMIRPCLLNLRDIGALQLDSIYDQTDMSETRLGQLHLTSIGDSMQKEGKLPGADSTDRLRFFYNVLTNQLVRDSVLTNYQEKPHGIIVREMESAEEAAFPASLAFEAVEKLKNQKECPPWLEKETIIKQVVPDESDLLWRNIVKAFNIKKGMKCSVEGNNDPDVDAAALNGLDLTDADEDSTRIKAEVPDAEFAAIVPYNQLQSLLERINSNGNLLIADASLHTGSIRSFTGGKTNVNIRFITRSEENKAKLDRNLITVFVKDSLLPDGLVYLDTSQAVGHGAFTLSAGYISRTVELAYIPKGSVADIREVILDHLENHYRDLPELLHIYRAFGMPAEELRAIEKYVVSLGTIDEKIRFLSKLNDESVTVFKSKFLNDEKINELILDADAIIAGITDVSSALNVLEHYSSIDAVRNRSTTIEALLRLILVNIKDSVCYSDIISLWESIQSLGKQYVRFIKQENLYQSLYSDAVLREMTAKLPDDDFYSIEEYTQYETALREIRNTVDRTQEALGINLLEEASESRFTESVLLHRSELDKIIELLELWRNNKDIYESRFGSFEKMAAEFAFLGVIDANYQKLSSVLSMFCCDKALKYSRLCILDTNSLMNMPELFKMLDGKDTMVIVPQVMLTELDRKKKDDDEETAYQAREAIRQIDNYSAFDWVNLREQSRAELLSGDLDPKHPDCRIISVALKYIIHKPVLITDDVNMRNLAKSQGISTMTTEGFAASIEQAERERKQEKENNNKSKKKRKR